MSRLTTKQRRARKRNREFTFGWVAEMWSFPPLPPNPTMEDVIRSAYSATCKVTCGRRRG